jgi:hypothetical protein
MNGRGKLTIEVDNASLDDNYAARHVDVLASQHVMLAIGDHATAFWRLRSRA